VIERSEVVFIVVISAMLGDVLILPVLTYGLQIALAASVIALLAAVVARVVRTVQINNGFQTASRRVCAGSDTVIGRQARADDRCGWFPDLANDRMFHSIYRIGVAALLLAAWSLDAFTGLTIFRNVTAPSVLSVAVAGACALALPVLLFRFSDKPAGDS